METCVTVIHEAQNGWLGAEVRRDVCPLDGLAPLCRLLTATNTVENVEFLVSSLNKLLMLTLLIHCRQQTFRNRLAVVVL